ncbi:MAG: family 16 glycosylhydrolase [Salinivirgaceae bacterium]|nr:family 16 glycosylhydrolase [Salinivirgaceae bacterium]
MANLGFSLRSTFGLIPKTEKIEELRKLLQDEYNRLQEYKESEELKEFIELDEYINSEAFKKAKNDILLLNFKTTDEFQKELRYTKLVKDKRIVNYFKVNESDAYKEFINTEESAELEEYKTLEDYLSGNEHKEVIGSFATKLKEEQDKEKEYKQLTKSKKIVDYYKISKSAQLQLNNELDGSEELTEFNELKDFIESDQLQEFKSAIAEQLQIEKNKKNEIKQLAKNPEITAYKKEKNKEEIEKPQALVDLEELQNYIKSSEYQQKLSELQYKNTEEFKKEQRFKTLQKSSRLKRYFKFAVSQQLAFYNDFKDSNELKQYEDLKEYVHSEDYKTNLAEATYNNSDEYQKELRFKELSDSQQIKYWKKYQKSKPYLLFKEIENSDLLNEYNELHDYINSDEFIDFKTYMLDKDKWKKTEDFEKESRHEELKKSDNIKWYYSVKDSDKFDALLAWKLTFEEDFDSGKIDEQKWMNSFFWGKMLLNDRYVQAGDKHYYTDNKNFELNGTTLKILTKQESAKGKVWNPIHGFFNTDFEYTSGMLSTAHNFRQKYGRFEAKVKVDSKYPVYQAFWLKGEKIVPEIDVFKFNMDRKNRFQMSNFWGDANDMKSVNKTTEKINGSNLSKDFYIYTLDWTPEKLSWKINGFEVYSATQGIPDEPLYMILSAGVNQKATPNDLPSAFEIDWVRCYEKVD